MAWHEGTLLWTDRHSKTIHLAGTDGSVCQARGGQSASDYHFHGSRLRLFIGPRIAVPARDGGDEAEFCGVPVTAESDATPGP